MLRKLLFQQQERKQLVIAIIGALLGFTFLIAAVHYLVKVNDYGKSSDMLGANVIIAQKKVNMGSMIGLGNNVFSETELEELRQSKFIDEVGVIESNNFNISFQTDDKQVPYFRTDIFVQTLAPQFLDVKTDKWRWDKSAPYVPIILPRDFLVMMNTFMSSMKMPPISEDLAMTVGFKFMLKKGDRKEYYPARVVGFTNEIGSVLVPASFMAYGNTAFQLDDEPHVTQIAIRSKEGSFGLLQEHMDEYGYETKNSQAIIGRLKSVVNILLSIILSISIVTVVASSLVLIQYAQLLITRNAYTIRTLLRIGYAPKTIIKQFQNYFVRLFGLITLLAYGIFSVAKLFIDQLMMQGGLDLGKSHTFVAPIIIFGTFLVFSLVSYQTAKKEIFKDFE